MTLLLILPIEFSTTIRNSALVMWITALLVAVYMVKRHGRELVNNPSLVIE